MMHNYLVRALLALPLLVSTSLHAQGRARAASSSSALPVLSAERTHEQIRIDGRLDEGAWSGAGIATGLVQRNPDPGAPATERTEARVLYDGDALYVGMRMYDSRPDSIAAPLGRRDMRSRTSDWAYVMLDSYDDNRTAFVFGVNPRAVKTDYLVHGDADEDLSWDAVWEVAARVDSAGWTAEFRIPLSQLRFSPSHAEWGLNLQRSIARRNEAAFWAPWLPDAPGYVSSFGRLVGVGSLKAPGRLEFQPYTTGRLTRAPRGDGDPFFRENAVFASGGLDLKYGLSSDLTLTATFNPDFGQVEADPSQVNLTAFETFYTERRPFFVEGTEVFQFDLGQVDVSENEQLFYSRRVGRAPQRDPYALGEHADAPEATTILGAVKLSGRIPGGWSVGVLNATTAPERAHVLLETGRDTIVPVEPLTNYFVARLSKNGRDGRSAVGGILTATNRHLAEGSGLDFLRSAAYVGGLDARHRFGGGNYELNGWVLGSHVEGSRRAIRLAQRAPSRYLQRPDRRRCNGWQFLCMTLDTTRTSLDGMSTNVQLDKIGGGSWRWTLKGTARTPGFEVNDFGYQRLADAATVIGALGYVQFQPGPTFRSWNLNVSGGTGWSFAGERVLTAGTLQGSFLLRNFWGGSGTVLRLFPVLSPTALRGGPALRTPGQFQGVLEIHSNPRKTSGVELNSSAWREDETGGHGWSLNPAVRLRPSGGAELSFGPTLERTIESWQYVSGVRSLDGERHYVHAQLRQTTAALTARLDYAFTPDLSLQLYAQPFISAGRFDSFREVRDPRARRYRERFRAFADDEITFDAEAGVYRVSAAHGGGARLAFANPSFNFKELRSNAVLRWEYRPGSTLFLVWSQGRADHLSNGAFDLLGSLGELFDASGTNVLLVKVSYWFDL